MPRRIPRFIDWPFRSAARIQRDVDEELAFELDLRTRDLMATGVSEVDARCEAVAEFGDLEATRRYCAAQDRDADAGRWRGDVVAAVRDDARLVWRGMKRSPAFALLVLATLALGIGANTAVLSVVSRVLLERLPYRAPDRLVRLWGATSEAPRDRGSLSAAELGAFSRGSRTLVVAPFGLRGGMTYVGDGATEMWEAIRVSPSFALTLGVSPLLGRTIDERDIAPGAPPVVVLSHALWARVFNADSAAVGRSVRLAGEQRTIVGVMRPDFVGPTFDTDVFMPLDIAAFERVERMRFRRMLGAVARLREGVSMAAASAELGVLTARVAAERPTVEQRGAPRARLESLREAMVGESRPVLLVVMGAAALVLAVACVNVAGLFLARAAARRRELAVRAALGAGRGRLVRLLLTESIVVALAGGALGVAFAYWARTVLLRVGDRLLPSTGSVPMRGGMLLIAALLAVACGVAFGLVPALVATRPQSVDALRESSRGAAGGRGSARAGRVLVAGQAALAVLLLVGAGLLGRTLAAIEGAGVGYVTDRSVLSFIVTPGDRYADGQSRARFIDDVLARLDALPGAVAAGVVDVAPWNGPNGDRVTIEGNSAVGTSDVPVAVNAATPRYFEAIGIPLRRGRALAADDRPEASPVVLVSETLARRWPDGNAVGGRLRIGTRDTVWREVVGVVGDVREGASSEPDATVYVPAAQRRLWGGQVILRMRGDAMTVLPAVRRAVRELDPTVPVVLPRPMDDVFRSTLAGQRLPTLFTAAFALLALLLAAIGVYGVMAYSVAARTRELGIRAALGAGRGGIAWLVARQALAPAVAGTALGIALAALASRAIAGLLVGVTPHDPLTFLAAPALLLAVASTACLIPARRAMRADPAEALRAD